MDWARVAHGSWADNAAFTSLSGDQQLRELRNALSWATKQEGSFPKGCGRVAVNAIHLMDTHRIYDESLRTGFELILGIAAAGLGESAEAGLHLRKFVNKPSPPGTAGLREQALKAYGELLLDEEPGKAAEVLRPALTSARSRGRHELAAEIASSLGIALRETGQVTEARDVYEAAIQELSGAGASPRVRGTLARLHANLGNVLTHHQGLHAEAAQHYSFAADLFDEIGDYKSAGLCHNILISATLRQGSYAAALQLIENIERVLDGPVGLRQILEEALWAQAAEHHAVKWDAFFVRLLGQYSGRITEMHTALLIGARVILCRKLGDDVEAIRLAHDVRLQLIGETTYLGGKLKQVTLELMGSHNCPGIMWPVLHLFGNLGSDAHRLAKYSYYNEMAALWMANRALQRAGEVVSADNPVLDEANPPVIYGIGSVEIEPPAWMGPTDRRFREEFARLRRLYPDRETLGNMFIQYYGPNLEPYGSGKPGSEEKLLRAVWAADLLGLPQLQVSARVALVSCISWKTQDGEPTGRQEALKILDVARSIAEQLPEEQITVHLAVANTLDEAHVGDEAARLSGAIAEVRRAIEIMDAHSLPDKLPFIAVTLANMLSEPAGAGLPELLEAKGILQRALAAVRANPPEDIKAYEGALHASLGKVFLVLGERDRSPQNYAAAVDSLRRAVQDGPGNQLISVANLLGALIRSARYGGADVDQEITLLIDRIRFMSGDVSNPEDRIGALVNAAVALQEGNRKEAKDLVLEAVAIARNSGPSRLRVETFAAAGRIHFDFGDMDDARALFEQAAASIDDFRRLNKNTRYRAELTERFKWVYRYLEEILERQHAPTAERWWVVERNTGRTVLESLPSKDVLSVGQESVIQTLGSRLPDDTVLFHVYLNKRSEMGCFVLDSRNGRLRIRQGGHPLSIQEMSVSLGGYATDTVAGMPVLSPSNPSKFHDQLAWLGTGFLGPMLDGMDMTRVSRIVFASQVFSHLPWHAVPLPGRPSLGQSFEVISVPSFSLLARLLNAPRAELRKASFVACDPTRKLRQHIEECRHSFSALNIPDTIVLTDTSRSVSKQAVIEILGETNVFHFSGHSTLRAGRPEESGLLLSDGLLNIIELQEALARHAPSVVFLSSCESSAVDHLLEDAPNLSSVFLQAGAQMVIGALWSVPDSVASFTARKFYERLRVVGPVQALRSAQLELMSVSDNYDWATFRIQGWVP